MSRTSLAVVVLLLMSWCPHSVWSEETSRPNILWITSEDNGPHLGCYGDRYADTPTLDALAAKGLRYRTCWSNAPVCAPARTTIITGVYPTSTGSEHMRSNVRMPSFMKMFPQFLRESGYYCTNNSKEDYNLEKPTGVWDESSPRGHWKNRRAGQPFFAVFNHTITHESQIRKRPHKAVHDPAQVRVPAYHPDTPEVRQDWAQYYDNITTMDGLVAKNLKELNDADLADDTIVFYFGDHGSGMPRSKRTPCDSGLHVPLLVYIPDKFAHLRPKEYRTGGESDRLVSFVDLAPTVLSLIGIKPTDWMQGHAFAGKFDAGPQPYVYGFRGRMDERLDLIRSVRDQRYVYVRQFMPHKPYGQHVSYMFETPTTRVWKQLFDAGKLNAAQSIFWQEKSFEELYDLQSDPDEIRNLAALPEHQTTLQRLRTAHRELVFQVRDVDFLPENEIHSRAKDSSPYEVGRDDARYPLKRIYETAELAAGRRPESVESLRKSLADEDSAVRYWSALGLLMQREHGFKAGQQELRAALKDLSPSVRVIAAQSLAQYGEPADQEVALKVLIALANVQQQGIYVSVMALNAIDELDDRARTMAKAIRALPSSDKATPQRLGDYVERLKTKTLSDLDPAGSGKKAGN